MQKPLKISLIQAGLIWEDRDANRAHFDKLIDAATGADIILLPEMFTTGFTMNASKIAESVNGTTVNWMLEKASATQSLIGGSLVIEENGRYFNRFIAAFPDGRTVQSDKRHLFSFAGEDQIYTPGTERVVFEFRGFRIFPLICYDLRFPVWARYKDDYDLLIYVANWPAPRINAWDALLKARAIENMCYVTGLNRVGTDANGLQYPGHSAIYDPLGAQLAFNDSGKEGLISATLLPDHLRATRKNFGFLNDRDDFKLL